MEPFDLVTGMDHHPPDRFRILIQERKQVSDVKGGRIGGVLDLESQQAPAYSITKSTSQPATVRQ